MKFRVTMKDPDTLYEAIKEAVDEQVEALPLDEDEREDVAETRIEKVKELCGTWFKYDEYLEVEIDTDAETCVVVPTGD